MSDFGNIVLALVVIFAPLAFAGWLLGRRPRGGPPGRAKRGTRPGRDNMEP